MCNVPTNAFAAAIGLDHIGIVGADLDILAREFSGLGFRLTPMAKHASGRTANRCAMLRDGGYLELIATVRGQSSATLDRFLAQGAGAHILALEIADEAGAIERLRRAGVSGELSTTEREAGADGVKARFALITPAPEFGGVLLIRHLTRELLWRPDTTAHPNHAVAVVEAVYSTDRPAKVATDLSRLTGRPAEPDPLGGYCIPLARGRVRILPRAAAAALFPGAPGAAPLIGVTIATDLTGAGATVLAGGLAIRFIPATG